MHVVITGGTGMLGRRLALRILAAPELVGRSGRREEVTRLTLFDAFDPAEPPPDDPRVRVVTGDLRDPGQAAALIGEEADAVFHFAAVVSGGAEADLPLCCQATPACGRTVLEARTQGVPAPPGVVTHG